MKRYREKEIAHIRRLRRTYAYSFIQLSRISGIPQTTIRNWCYPEDIHNKSDTLRATNERRRQEYKKSEIHSLASIKVDKSVAKLLGAVLYWCEGAKYPSTNRVSLVNSDVGLIKTFVYLLRQGFSIDESKFTVHLQIHNTHKFLALKKFWSNSLGIPESQFIKPTITSAHGKKHRVNYMGTCTVRYNDYSLQLKLIGLYEAFTSSIGVSN